MVQLWKEKKIILLNTGSKCNYKNIDVTLYGAKRLSISDSKYVKTYQEKLLTHV